MKAISSDDLSKKTKADLAAVAQRMGISSTGKTKQQLIKEITSGLQSRSESSQRKSASQKSGKTASAQKDSRKSSSSPSKDAATLKRAKAGATLNGRQRGTRDAKKATVKAKSSQSAKKKSSSKSVAAPSSKSSSVTRSKKASSSGTTRAQKGSLPSSKSPQTKAATKTAKPSKIGSVRTGQPSPSRKLEGSAIDKAKSAKGSAAGKSKVVTKAKVLNKIRQMQLQREASKDIGFRPRLVQPPGAGDPVWEKEPKKDQIGLFVRDPYWLHAVWDITRNAVERAQAALAEQWHGARPVLRLVRLDENGSSTAAEAIQTEVEIRGGLRNWYLPWTGESAIFRVSIGYLGAHGRFHAIASSNTVKTPSASSADAVEDHWSHVGSQAERIFALSGGYDAERETNELKQMLEVRLNRSLGAPELAKLAIAADLPHRHRADFQFDMEVELVFYGVTEPNGYLTINEEPVPLRPDGSFAVRLPFPDKRQVIPAVAVARDGSHQRTIVVAVERNTKVMEPFDREQDVGD